MDFSGKRVLVTGAGKGIGRATAELLSKRGAIVLALSRATEDLESLRLETGCECHVVDLEDWREARSAAKACLPVDLLVNCAGVVYLEPFLETTAQTLDRTMAVNLRAPMILAQEVAADLIRRGERGAIVNVSSIAADVGTPDHTAYCASKAALDAMTRVMAVELGREGIRVNSVNPVVTLTPMGEKAWSDPVKARPMLDRIPLRRFAQPHEIASAIAYLLSDDASMVNGVCLSVDGGFRAG